MGEPTSRAVIQAALADAGTKLEKQLISSGEYCNIVKSLGQHLVRLDEIEADRQKHDSFFAWPKL
jgi:hypothetical protein